MKIFALAANILKQPLLNPKELVCISQSGYSESLFLSSNNISINEPLIQ